MKTQTAIEWFQSQIINIVNGDCELSEIEIFEQAKAMEKEQHNETWDSAHQAGRFEGKGIAEENWQTFETYWEETYKLE